MKTIKELEKEIEKFEIRIKGSMKSLGHPTEYSVFKWVEEFGDLDEIEEMVSLNSKLTQTKAIYEITEDIFDQEIEMIESLNHDGMLDNRIELLYKIKKELLSKIKGEGK